MEIHKIGLMKRKNGETFWNLHALGKCEKAFLNFFSVQLIEFEMHEVKKLKSTCMFLIIHTV